MKLLAIGDDGNPELVDPPADPSEQIGQLASDLDALQQQVGTDETKESADAAKEASDAASLQGSITALQGSTGPTLVSGPLKIAFDDLKGTSDDDKAASLNAYHASLGAQTAHSTVFMPPRPMTLSKTPIALYSGISLASVRLGAARGDGSGPSIKWAGPAGSSLFSFVGSQPGQTYPADGSPRDISILNMQLRGNRTNHLLPKFDPSKDASSGRVLWYCEFRDLALTDFATLWWGWGDGTVWTGVLDMANCTDTLFHAAGSECSLFDSGTFSFINVSASDNLAVPLIRSRLSKSRIGMCMPTTHKQSWALSVEGGSSLDVTGFSPDARGDDPTYGAAVRVLAGDGIVLRAMSLKGCAASPAQAVGGAAVNGGWIDVSGGTQIVIDDVRYRREGSSVPATDFPVVHVGPNVGKGQVKIGLGAYSGWNGAQPVVAESSPGQIVCIDPTVKVTG